MEPNHPWLIRLSWPHDGFLSSIMSRWYRHMSIVLCVILLLIHAVKVSAWMTNHTPQDIIIHQWHTGDVGLHYPNASYHRHLQIGIFGNTMHLTRKMVLAKCHLLSGPRSPFTRSTSSGVILKIYGIFRVEHGISRYLIHACAFRQPSKLSIKISEFIAVSIMIA